MSHSHYDRISSLLDLYQNLGEAEALDSAGEKGKTHKEIIQNLRKKYNE
jgi:hypothetical protein